MLAWWRTMLRERYAGSEPTDRQKFGDRSATLGPTPKLPGFRRESPEVAVPAWCISGGSIRGCTPNSANAESEWPDAHFAHVPTPAHLEIAQWSGGESNSRLLACKASALPTELNPRSRCSISKTKAKLCAAAFHIAGKGVSAFADSHTCFVLPLSEISTLPM